MWAELEEDVGGQLILSPEVTLSNNQLLPGWKAGSFLKGTMFCTGSRSGARRSHSFPLEEFCLFTYGEGTTSHSRLLPSPSIGSLWKHHGIPPTRPFDGGGEMGVTRWGGPLTKRNWQLLPSHCLFRLLLIFYHVPAPSMF